MEKRFQGVYPVVFTPLTADHAIDVSALQKNLDYLMSRYEPSPMTGVQREHE